MNNKQSITWLASYPKSGNTWMRVFLTNYLSSTEEPVNINQLWGYQVCTDRELFDEIMGINSSNLSLEAQEKLRPIFHQHLANESVAPYFVKTHDAYSFDGLPLFPQLATLGVIYIVRNPLDIAVSFAHHENTTVETIIERMANKKQMLSYKKHKLYDQLPQLLNSWSGHVKSWLDESTLRTLIVRYEDMHQQPEEVFRKVIEFCNLEVNEFKLQQAIEFSSFDLLQKQEAQQGLAMKQATAKSFFRKGNIEDWRNILSNQQTENIIKTHFTTMQRLGYL